MAITFLLIVTRSNRTYEQENGLTQEVDVDIAGDRDDTEDHHSQEGAPERGPRYWEPHSLELFSVVHQVWIGS